MPKKQNGKMLLTDCLLQNNQRKSFKNYNL